MDVLAHLEPTQAMLDAATPHVEAARRTTMHAGHHARAALIDAAAADHRPRGAVSLSAEELHCLICAMAGNFPAQFAPIRMDLLRKLAKASRAAREQER